jgi:hypothetical protein
MATYEAGDCVKAELADEAAGGSEWLWVRVERCDEGNRALFGRLDNQPVVLADELRHGQQIAVSFANIPTDHAMLARRFVILSEMHIAPQGTASVSSCRSLRRPQESRLSGVAPSWRGGDVNSREPGSIGASSHVSSAHASGAHRSSGKRFPLRADTTAREFDHSSFLLPPLRSAGSHIRPAQIATSSISPSPP